MLSDMATKFKLDHTPIFGPGYHNCSLIGLQDLCVAAFPQSKTRPILFVLFQSFIDDINKLFLPCSVWVDGSFLTEKENPSDIDVWIILDLDVALNLTVDQRQFIDDVNDPTKKYNKVIDGYAFVCYPFGHTLYGSDLDERQGWAEHIGLQRDKQWCKGVAVLRIGETDVGLRLYP